MYLMGDSLGDFAASVLHCAAWRRDGSRLECAVNQIPELLAEEGSFLWLATAPAPRDWADAAPALSLIHI